MVDFFSKSENRDEELARRAHPHGDIDTIISPVDGALVVVSQVGGVHVCQQCFGNYTDDEGNVGEKALFVNDTSSPRRPVEWKDPQGQGTRILLHAMCIGPAKKQGGALLFDLVRGHQAKRFATRAMKGIDNIFKNGR